MKYFGEGLSGLHKELNQIIRREDKTGQAKALFLDIHAKLNLSQVSGAQSNEVDSFLVDLRREEYAVMPSPEDETIAWVLQEWKEAVRTKKKFYRR